MKQPSGCLRMLSLTAACLVIETADAGEFADAFSRFEEEGIFNAETGADFMHQILEQGGSRSPMKLFRAFRGREPNIDALLRHSGITG